VLDAHKEIVAYLVGLVTVFENNQYGTTDEVYDLGAFAYMVALRGVTHLASLGTQTSPTMSDYARGSRSPLR
jgi:hypothetical protein